jgi:hypothetical protein
MCIVITLLLHVLGAGLSSSVCRLPGVRRADVMSQGPVMRAWRCVVAVGDAGASSFP